MATTKTKASFIEPMLLLRSESLSEDPNWSIELFLPKLDGYLALAIQTGKKFNSGQGTTTITTPRADYTAAGIQLS